MSKKFTSTVAGASILLTGVGLLSRGLGLVREVVFAGSFGLSKQYDLFLVGTVIPLTINTIVIYIAQNYFIPVYNRLKKNSLEGARVFIIKSVLMFVVAGFFLMCLIFFLSDQIIGIYLNYPDLVDSSTAIEVLRIYAFTIPFNAAFSILAAYLYSEFEFKLPTFSQLFVNVSVIILVLLFAGTLGVESIAIGYLLGTILQLLFVVVYIFKGNNKIPLSNVKIKLFYWDSSLLLIVFIEALSQIYLISDRYFLSRVDEGGIAALNYSMNLYLLPISIISVALSTALFPSFSKSFVEKNIDEIKYKLHKFFSINLYLFIPMTFIFFYFGDLIISIIFERGAFSHGDSQLTFETLRYFSISLVFYSGYSILNKLIYSMELAKQLLIITIIGCLIKVILNFMLVSYFKQNGLALSSSISYIFFFSASMILTKKKLHLNLKDLFARDSLFIIFNSFFALLLSAVLVNQIFQFIGINFVSNLVQLIFFIIIYLINSLFINRDSINLFFRTFRI